MKSKLIKNYFGFEYFLADENGSAIATSDNGKLSKQNCDEIFGVVDEDKKNLYYYKQVMNPYETAGQSYTAYEKGFIEGFNKAMELNKDKVFTSKDVIRAIVHHTYLLYNDGKGYEEGDNNDDRIECVIAALKQKPIEIEVEIVQEKGKDTFGNSELTWYNSKIDSQGCLILKRAE
jgi:hypothetical protein